MKSQSTFQSDLFQQFPVVGILRGFRLDTVCRITETVLKNGLLNLEITMNTKWATEQIKKVKSMVGDQMNIGAGTVLSIDDLESALEAGAEFIVTPVVNEEIIKRCRQLSVPIFPGAYSPSEIERAWNAGADMVKLFPADLLGPAYLKSVKAPLPEIRMMPTGGIGLNNLSDYRKAGADGYGVGSPLFQKERMENEDWVWLGQQVRSFKAFFEDEL